MIRKTIFASSLVLCLLVGTLVLAQEMQLKGMITRRTADNMTVQTSDASVHNVVLTDDTKVQMPKGLGLRHKQVAWTSLIPGLAVTVKGMPDEKGQIVASKVQFTKDDLQTASMIQAGLAPTQQQVQAHEQSIAKGKEAILENRENTESNTQQIAANMKETNDRFDSLTDYNVMQDLSVYFKPGNSTLSEKDKVALSQLAAAATKMQGYLIEVKGFADSTGGASMNQALSKNRAESVVNHLLQNCNVPPRHVLSPGAMGISNPAASNETTQGRANNRRVEVKVMVNKAVGGPAGQ